MNKNYYTLFQILDPIYKDNLLYHRKYSSYFSPRTETILLSNEPNKHVILHAKTSWNTNNETAKEKPDKPRLWWNW